jgi:hypothetical protein
MRTRVLSARVLSARVWPEVARQPGFAGALALVDPSTGKGMMITLWATPEDLLAGEASGFVNRQVATVAPYLREPARRETFVARFVE